MKKYRKRKLIVIFILIMIVSPLVLSYANYKLYNIKASCSSEVENYLFDIINQDGSLYRNLYLDFSCDGFYIISPYTTSEYKHKKVGQKWYHYYSYGSYLFNELLFDGDTISENQQQLVFIKDDKVVSIAILDRKNEDFLNLKQSYYDIDTVFYNKARDNRGYRIILDNN